MFRIVSFVFIVAAATAFGLCGTPSTIERPTPTVAPTITGADLASLPDACRPLVAGTVFAEGMLGDRVRAANAWADEHPGDTESLVVTDELMRDAATREQWSVPVRDVDVAIDASGVHLAATVATIGRATVRAVLVPEVVDGRLRLTVHELDTGGLPALFRPAIEEAIATASDTSRWDLRPHVDGVTTQRGCAVVWGRG